MPKISQNLIILKDPFDDPYEISYDGGNMALNQFCIDEDAAFELSGIYDLKKLISFNFAIRKEIKSKGKEYMSHSGTISER